MSRLKSNLSPGVVLGFVAVFLMGAGGATAAKLIDGSKLKPKSVTIDKFAPSAKKKLKGKQGDVGPAGPTGAAGPAGAAGTNGTNGTDAAKYWATVNANGTIHRQSGGISGTLNTNGNTNAQYLLTFPTDVSGCSYQATAGDPGVVGNSEFVIPRIPAIARSNQGANTIVVQLYIPNDGAGDDVWIYIQDSFHVAVFC